MLNIKNMLFVALAIAVLSANAQQRRSNPSLDSLRNEKDPVALQQKIQQKINGSENDMQLIVQYYAAERNSVKGDSITKLIIARFPKGVAAFNQAASKINAEPNTEKREEIYKKLRINFPPELNFDNASYSIAYAYAGSRNTAKVKAYQALIKDPGFRTSSNIPLGELVIKYDLKGAGEMIKNGIDQLSKDGTSASTVQTDGMRNMDRTNYIALLRMYTTILLKTGQYKEGLQYAKIAYDGSQVKSELVSGNYGLLLNKNGEHAEALAVLQKLVETGKGNPELNAALAESYAKLNPGKNAQAYLAGLEKSGIAMFESEIAKKIISEPAPDFTIKDANGKTVSLADFKGKTLVLDFWATWCGPCKKSFPAMQLAVNKYKHDPNVKFLFIHTSETSATPLADAKSYLNSNNYTFDLYMDTRDLNTKVCPVATAFKVTGIPAKFIIDALGNIRFKVMGFSGSDEAGAVEVSAMVEMARKSNTKINKS